MALWGSGTYSGAAVFYTESCEFEAANMTLSSGYGTYSEHAVVTSGDNSPVTSKHTTVTSTGSTVIIRVK